LPLPDEVLGPLPNEKEGSDHVPLVAMLAIGARQAAGGQPGPPAQNDSNADVAWSIATRFEALAGRWASSKHAPRSAEVPIKSLRETWPQKRPPLVEFHPVQIEAHGMSKEYAKKPDSIQDSKTMLTMFAQLQGKKPITKEDILYSSVELPLQYQVSVTLNCMEGKHFVGKPAATKRQAEQNAATIALQTFGDQVAAVLAHAKKTELNQDTKSMLTMFAQGKCEK